MLFVMDFQEQQTLTIDILILIMIQEEFGKLLIVQLGLSLKTNCMKSNYLLAEQLLLRQVDVGFIQKNVFMKWLQTAEFGLAQMEIAPLLLKNSLPKSNKDLPP